MTSINYAPLSPLLEQFVERELGPRTRAAKEQASGILRRIKAVANEALGCTADVDLRGSFAKGTNGPHSDLDMVVKAPMEVTRSLRAAFAAGFEEKYGVPIQISTNAVTIQFDNGMEVDVTFERTTYGAGIIPYKPSTYKVFQDVAPFRIAVQAIKLLGEYRNLPNIKGRFWEQLVLHAGSRGQSSLRIFVAALTTLAEERSCSELIHKLERSNYSEGALGLAMSEGAKRSWADAGRRLVKALERSEIASASDFKRVFEDPVALPYKAVTPSSVAGERKVHQCQTCKKGKYSSVEALRQHHSDSHRANSGLSGAPLRVPTPPKPASECCNICPFCPRQFRNKQAQQQHIAASHPRYLGCGSCNRLFKSADALLDHRRDRHIKAAGPLAVL
ncbi:hypothetical protein BC832DRAFT_621919 [Gaertneriomyces semiglobifer]|nr:hypothetical protein BC832DRAFT_621919 [Gaertneriomyces semiglobifer]